MDDASSMHGSDGLDHAQDEQRNFLRTNGPDLDFLVCARQKPSCVGDAHIDVVSQS